MDRTAKKVYLGSVWVFSKLTMGPWKRSINSVNDCLNKKKKKGLKVPQARRVVYEDMNGRVCEGECLGHVLEDELLFLMRCYSCQLSQLCKAFRGRDFCGQACNLRV